MNTNLKSSALLSDHQHHASRMNSLALIKSAKKLDRPTAQQQQSIAHIYAEQAKLYLQERNWEAAILACKNALETDSQNAQAYKTLGNILKLKGKKAEALGVYAKALAINPNSAAIYANLGSFYAEQKDWQQALDYFQQAVILEPNLAGAYRSLAQIWEELGDTNQALECLCQAVQLEPGKLTASEYFNFGQELYQQGKVKEASIFYTQGVKLNPQAATELAQLVQMLEELEEWQEAVNYYHKLISLARNKADLPPTTEEKPIKNLLSRAQLALAPATAPQQPATSLPIASRLLSSLKTQRPPENAPENALENSPEDVSKESAIAVKQSNSAASWNNLGCLYGQKQQWAKAIGCFQEALQIDPQQENTYRNLAKAYLKMGKKSQAALCWYEVFTLRPDTIKPEDHFSLAKTLLQQNHVDKAIFCLRQAIRLKPDFNRAHLILGKLYEKQGQSEAAQACYQNISSQPEKA